MVHKQRAQRRGPIEQLVYEIFQDFIQGRLVRCAKCKLFYAASLAKVASCSVCTYTTGRCFNCDGMEGAQRSVLTHIRVFSGPQHRDNYGDAHFDAKVRIDKKKKLKLVKGGR